MTGERAGCWEIPGERIVCLRWVKAQQPETWRHLWRLIVRGWLA